MLGADAEPYTLAGAFLLGAALATVALLRIVRMLTDFFAGVERRRFRRPREPEEEP